MAYSGENQPILATILPASTIAGGFTHIVVITETNSPSFWTNIDTSDATKSRVSNYAKTEEWAFDCFYFDNGAVTKTAIYRFRDPNDISSSAYGHARIYPPKSANASYVVSDTYGQYNAYDANFIYYSPNGAGDNNRVSASITGSYTGTPTIDAESGLCGKSTLYGGLASYWQTTDAGILNTSDMTMSMFFKHSSGTPYALGSSTVQSTLRPYSGTLRYYHNYTSISDGTYSYNAYNYAHASIDASGNVSFGINNNTPTTGTMSTSETMDDFSIGYHYANTDTYIQHVTKTNTARDATWKNYEYSQVSDNSTFWTFETYDTGGETGVTVSASDSLGMSDSSTVSISLSLSVLDSISLTESDSEDISIVISANDGVTFSETDTQAIYISTTGTDSLNIGDGGTTGGIIPISGSDSVLLSDSASIIVYVSVDGTDTISLSEVVEIIHALTLTGEDGLTISSYARQAGVIEGILRMALTATIPNTSIVAKESYIELSQYRGKTDITVIEQN